jgi:hypothetical protein
VPQVRGAVATRLAYYRSHDLGVLAPRGWQCFTLYGSDGAILVVSPDALGSPPLVRGFQLPGRAVVLSFSYGGTSGRYAVARAIFQLFPAYRKLAERVAADWELAEPLDSPPPPSDRVARRSATVVDFLTPPGKEGLGTRSRLEPGVEAIAGSVILLPGDEPDVIQVDLRLGPQAEAEQAAILSHFHASRGGPLTTWR